MKASRTLLLVLALAAVPYVTSVSAQTEEDTPTVDDTQTTIQHGPNFVDEDGDGFNDNAPDHDGDGIPNGQDADWQRPQDGSGQGQGLGNGSGNKHRDIRGKRYGLNNGTCDGTSIRQRLRDASGAGGQYGPATGGGTGLRRGGNGKGRSAK